MNRGTDKQTYKPVEQKHRKKRRERKNCRYEPGNRQIDIDVHTERKEEKERILGMNHRIDKQTETYRQKEKKRTKELQV